MAWRFIDANGKSHGNVVHEFQDTGDFGSMDKKVRFWYLVLSPTKQEDEREQYENGSAGKETIDGRRERHLLESLAIILGCREQ